MNRAAVPAVLLLLAGCARDAERPRNLLIVCVDTLRADELGAYGAEPSRTPELDRLAAASVVFESARSAASWTLPSIGATFTAEVPSTTGLWTAESRLGDSFVTLAERFAAAGFDTHGVASHVYFDGRYGLNQGFATFDTELCRKGGASDWVPITSPEVAARATRWLLERPRGAAARPWLLFVHFFDPHVPYHDHEAPRPDVSSRSERERYRSEIAFTDGHFGRLLGALERAGFADDTAVLFFSDHGEAFQEHPPIRRHSYGLYDEELRVPLFLRAPGLAPQRVRAPVRSIDLLPTLLELFGLGAPDLADMAGSSLLPLLAGRADAARPLLAEIRLKDGFHADVLVRGRHKLYHQVSDGRLRLFDLESDPLEQHDLAEREPELLAELRAELEAAIAAARAKAARFGPAGAVEHTSEELEYLEQLGYSGETEDER